MTVKISINKQNILASYKNSVFYDGRLGNVKKVAVKQNSFDNVTKEFMILGNLQHKNILHVNVPPEQIEDKHVLITEIFECTLQDAVNKELDHKSIMIQLAHAVGYLKDQGIIHLDIAPRNIFIANDGLRKIPKLGNFENSQFGLEVNDINPRKLSEGFVAPEILARSTAFFGSCLWSLGCVYFYVITKGFKIVESRSSVEQKVLPRLNAKIQNSSSDNILIKDLLTNILKENHLNRIVAKDIVKHPYFWNTVETLNFLVNVAKTNEKSTDFYNKIRIDQHQVIGHDWTQRIEPELLNLIKRDRKNYKRKFGNGDEDDNLKGNNIKTLISTIKHDMPR